MGFLLMAGGAFASTITVNSTADAAADDGACTLREAIIAANTNTASGAMAGECVAGEASPTVDTIAFDIAGSGVRTITPVGGSAGGSDLQFITDPVTIDGYMQTGSQPNTNATGAINAVPLIELDGSSSSHCLVVFAPGTVTIRGLVINGCHSEAIDLESGSTTLIEGNFIGTDATGTMARGASSGISMFVQNGGLNFTAGGPTPDARNVISGSSSVGIAVAANLNSSIAATIQGNLIGTDKTGTVALPNQIGIASFGAGSDSLVLTIGGSAAGAGNVISGNTLDGVLLGAFTKNSVIQGNLVGTDPSGTMAVGNGRFGLHVSDGPLTIGGTGAGEGNVIAFNGFAGVFVESGEDGFRISGNSFFENGGLGIDLEPAGVNMNDAMDPDPGANGRQNFPELNAPDFPGGSSVTGTLNSTPGHTFRIEVFANDECDPTLNGEGKTFVGTVDTAATDANGDVGFTVTFGQPIGATLLTATATDLANGDTSEFSACPVAPTTTTTSTTTTSTTETSTTETSTTETSTTTTSTTETSTTTSSTPTTSSTSTSTTATSTTSTSTTTTSTEAPTSTTSTTSTPTSSSTSTSLQPTTTTTVPAGGCDGVPDAPTFGSIRCRLEALRIATAAASELGDLRPKLDHTLGKALDRTAAAETACASDKAKSAKARLGQVIRQLIQYSHRLRGKKARKTAPESVREPLASAADRIQDDAKTLRRVVRCPSDAA